MHLSRLRIKNYKSIKELDLKFEKGKNVIIGKNNSGKSNILKAIDLVLGEKAPAYQKTQNITTEDFFNGNTKEPIYIFCELKRESAELLNYDEIYRNCNGFYIYGDYKTKSSTKIDLDLDQDFFDSIECNFFSIDLDTIDNWKKYYVGKKIPGSYEMELYDKFYFAYIFKAYLDENGKISKDIRLLYRNSLDDGWILSFNANIRNELLQSAIIPSFRDPSKTLRIADYTWFGKLLKNYISSEDEEFTSACANVKEASNKLFKEVIDAITDSKIEVAFPHTDISIQCSPKTIDAYKLAMIYVDDGFESLLTEKGSGIQSAVIIGLFDFYTRNIAHISSSLLAIEEPELYLHAHGRRIISQRLDEYLEGGKNQVIITTHSPEFISSVKGNLNLILVNKTQLGESRAQNIYFNDPRSLQIIGKSQNSEIFFADSVLLVEGADKYIVEEYAKEYGLDNKLGSNWLDNNNISIISANGKTQFLNYVSVLSKLNINWSIMADFDFIREGLKPFLEIHCPDISCIDELAEINSKLGSIDSAYVDLDLPPEINLKINDFVEDINSYDYPLIGGKVADLVKKSKKIKKIDDIPDPVLIKRTQDFIEDLKERKIFVLSGELENFFEDTLENELEVAHYKKGERKEQKIIYAVSSLLYDYSIQDLFNCEEFNGPLDCLSGVK